MAWAEVEDFTMTTTVGTTAAEYFPTFKVTQVYQLIWSRYIEELAVHFLFIQCDRWIDTLRDRMIRVNTPQNFLFVCDTPFQIAAGTHQLLERFGEVSGVQHDQSHAFLNTSYNGFSNIIINEVVCSVSPPQHNIGRVQNGFCQTMLILIQCCCAAGEPFFGQSVCKYFVNSIRVYSFDVVADLLMYKLIPDCYVNHTIVASLLLDPPHLAKFFFDHYLLQIVDGFSETLIYGH